MFNLLISIILKIIDCCTILGNYFLWQNYILSLNSSFHHSNFLVPPFYPKKNIKVGQIIRIILVPPLSSINLRRERSQKGSGNGGAWAPSVKNPSPLNEMTLSTMSTGFYGEPPVWVPVSASPRWRPLILKRLATPQLMRQIKTSLNLNMDIRDNYLVLLYSWSIYFTSPVNH